MPADFDVASYIASKGLDMRQASGNEVTVHCWACPDGDPKGRGRMYVNTEDGWFNCKRCGATGGTTLLLRAFGDEPDKKFAPAPGEDPAVRRRILEEATALGESMLSNNDDVMLYLCNDRGLWPETVVKHRFGVVRDGWSLVGGLPKHEVDDLKMTGLVYRDGPRAGKDFFYDHLLIPYRSRGTTVQMRGRALDPHSKAKYMTGPGDEVRLFNADALDGADDVMIIEGEFDTLVVEQALSLATEDRVRKIAVVGIAGAGALPPNFESYFKNAKRVYIGLDPDDTGKKGAVKIKELLGTRSRIMEWPLHVLEDGLGVHGIKKMDWSEWVNKMGATWRDIVAMMGTASGKRLSTMREAGEKWRTAKATGVGIKTGYAQLDATILPGILPGQVMVILAKTGTGKALRSDQPVLTENGWRSIGALREGDRVFGCDGQLHNVLGVFPQGQRDLFRVTFSDGAEVVCDGEHLWTFRTQGGDGPWSTATLNEIRDYKRVYVPIVEPIEFPTADLPVDPYLLGVLLGDGSLRGTCVTFTTDDEIAQALPLPDGLRLVRWADNGPGVGEYRISGVKGKDNALMRALTDLGLRGTHSHTKFVPDVYLRASIEQRLALLAGLLDTDGSIDPRTGSIEYSTSSPDLARGVQDLVSSLGGLTRPRWRSTTHKPSCRLTPSLPASLGNPLRLRRKAEAWRPATRSRRRSIVSIEDAGRADATCISVDSKDSLFITAGYVPTHNTVLLCNLAVAMRSQRVMFISLEMTSEEVYDRLRRIYLFHNPLATDELLEQALGNILICDENRLSDKDLESLVEEYEVETGHRPDVVYVDYLGYFARGQKGASAYEKTTNAVMQLKAVAKAYRMAVITPHQVNRMAKEGKPIDMDDARDSGAVEETADFLLSIYRPDDALAAEGQGQQSGRVKMSVLKSRHGGKDRTFTFVMDLLTLAIVDDTGPNAQRATEHNHMYWRGNTYEQLRKMETAPRQLSLVGTGAP